MSTSPHIADAESEFKVVNITPDFCRVGDQVIPFDIYRELPPEKSSYAKKVNARGVPVLMIDSVVRGVVGNMGKGIASGVSQGGGDTVMIEGVEKVRAEGRAVVRDQHLCLMNVKSG